MTALLDMVRLPHAYIGMLNDNFDGCEGVNIFGFNRDIATDFETIWNDTGSYVYPTSQSALTLVSTSASDTMAVLINGLDANYIQRQEVVTLTGTTPVVTAQQFFRINNAVILTGSNVGNITIKIGANLHGYIEAGQGATQACVYTVPAGKSLYLLRIDLTSGTVTGNKYLTYRQTLRSSNGRILRVAEATWQTGQQSFDRQVPFKIPEKTDFQFEAKSSSGSNEVSIFVEGFLG
jgi:hypothetical protein